MTGSSLLAGLDADGRRRIAVVLESMAAVWIAYFVCAGRVDLPWAWVYVAVSALSLALGALYVLPRNPAAINERGRASVGQKPWDRVIVRVYAPLSLGVYVVAGLDARFGWTGPLPVWVQVLAAVALCLQNGLVYSAMANNPFLSQVVRVQLERGHRVASTGPYRWIRHPMYAALLVSWPAQALVFGSLWALVPGGLAAAVILVRTALEDLTLRAELPGYAEYARRVRWRVFPGIW